MLFSYKGIFGFVHIQKEMLMRAFERRVRLKIVVETKLSPHHLMRLNILFLLGWHVNGSEVWFDANWLFFSFLFVPSLSSLDCMLTMQKNISALQFLFSFDSVLLFLLKLFYLHWLFLIEFIFDFVSSCLILLVFFIKFDPHSFNCYFFSFQSFS